MVWIAAALAVVSCGHAPPPGYHESPPTLPQEAVMPEDVPPLPAGDVVPTIAELADLLVSAFPERERAAARAALVDEVLPWDLRSLAGHSRPRRYVELVYEGLAKQLGADPAQRMARLGDVRCDRTFGRLTDRVAGLAIARYLRDRKGRPPAGLEPVDRELSDRFRDLDAAAFTAEVEHAAAELAAWEASAKAEHAPCHAAHRADLQHDRFALDNARTGDFTAASGFVFGFLHRAGERPRELLVH